MRAILLGLLAAGMVLCAQTHEVGEINGAQYRIDLPQTWNGVLLVYCHGYNPNPVKFSDRPPNPLEKALVDSGYALIQSGYATGGWAIQEALNDTQALQRYFAKKHGKAKETYVFGHSMGGFLTMTMLERFPNDFDGGLALCGPLASSQWFITRRVFDPLVVFAYFFPGVLPDPAAVPAGYVMTPDLNAATLKALESQPDKAAAIRQWMGIRTNKEFAGTMVFFTYVAKDLQERAGGNPFDNRNTVYEGFTDDLAVNAGVKRHTADPKAAEYIRTWYTPTGKLARPMLAINNVYDPLVPPWVSNMYSLLAEQSGSSGMFVQQYVKGAGHCVISPAEIAGGLKQLREWKSGGTRPAAGLAQ